MQWSEQNVIRLFKRIIIIFLMIMLAIIIIISAGYVAWSMIDKLVVHFDISSISTIIIEILGLFLLVFVSLELFATFNLYTKEHTAHVEAMLLVTLIAISRKIILLDYTSISLDILLGLSALVIAISAAYYLLKKTWISKKEKLLNNS